EEEGSDADHEAAAGPHGALGRAHLVLDLLRRLAQRRGLVGDELVAGHGFGRHAIGGLGSAEPSSPVTACASSAPAAGATTPANDRVRGPRSATAWPSLVP